MILENILDGILPQKVCFSCGLSIQSGKLKSICEKCAGSLKPISEISGVKCRKCCAYLYQSKGDICFECDSKKMEHMDNTSLFYYQDILIRELMHRFKFEGDTGAGSDLAWILKDRLAETVRDKGQRKILTVPLSRFSSIKRGYNQVEFILKRCGIEFDRVLVRTAHKKKQSELTFYKRQDGIKGQFKILPEKEAAVKGADILLIDDIYTSGSTVNEIGFVLKASGAKSVDALTFFRD